MIVDAIKGHGKTWEDKFNLPIVFPNRGSAMKLTQANVAKIKLPAGKSEHIEWDESLPGFGLRLRESGSKNWIVQYKIGAKHRRLTLGSLGQLTPDQARNGWEDGEGKKHNGAAIILANARHGTDAANDRAERRASAGNTFEGAVVDFLAFQKPRIAPSHYEATERYMNQHWKPLHGLAIESISRATVAAQLRVIAKERGDIAANRARAALSKFYAWEIGEGQADNNPVIGTNKAAEEEGRERVLTDAELAAVLKHAPEGDYGRIVRLLALTTCRRDEIGSLRWSEIEGKGKTALIALSGERTKNGRPHTVPLSKAALDVLAECPRRDGRDLVFGEGVGGFSGWSKAKETLDTACGVKEWTLHDLRRTGDTRMHDCGVLPHIVEAVLNHVSGHKRGVAGTYNKALYAAEKRDALDRLAGYIKTAQGQADSGNVRRLSRSAR
jgi:integrase